MAAGRVTFLLVLLLFATWVSITAQASQGGIPVSSPAEKGLLDAGTAAAARNIKNWEGGRKMVVINRKMKVITRGSTAVRESASKVTSIKYSKCGNDQDLAGCQKQSVGRHFSDEVVDDLESSSSSSGFVAFNADYHAPRHHPPKNN